MEEIPPPVTEVPCPSSELSPNSREYLYVAIHLLGWTQEQYMDCHPRDFHRHVQDYLDQHPDDRNTAEWLQKCSAKYEALAALMEQQQRSEAWLAAQELAPGNRTGPPVKE
jgi:hypothetical protein